MKLRHNRPANFPLPKGERSPARERRGARTLPACTGILILLAACSQENRYVAPPPPKVTVELPVQQTVTPYLEATGNTAAVNSVKLVARVKGFVQEIKYQDGATVKRGTTLFVIEPEPYEVSLQQAQAALEALRLVASDGVAVPAAAIWQHLRQRRVAINGDGDRAAYKAWQAKYWLLRREFVDSARVEVGLAPLDWARAGVSPWRRGR